MKVSIGAKILQGPFGGGNEFLRNLIIFLESNNVEVVNNLNHEDIDIILLTNPLDSSETSTFNNYDIDFYIKFKNSDAICFQRINECDERKKTNYINKSLDKFNKNIDINIFVSEWLYENFKPYELSKKDYHIVRGGPNPQIFNTNNRKVKVPGNKIKIVTHHWSDNWNKGFNFYKKLDSLLSESDDFKNIEFTVIGNKPNNLTFKNTNLIEPLHGEELSLELQKHDLYLTASENEPSGNHHMEGALCGLPILYINSGALPEYCKDFGVQVNFENILQSIEEIDNNYDYFINKLESYKFTSLFASKHLLNIFTESIQNKEKIIKKRKKLNSTVVLFNFLKSKIVRNVKFIFKILLRFLGKLKRFTNK